MNEKSMKKFGKNPEETWET